MSDMWHKFTKWADYNRYTFILLFVAIVFSVGMLLTVGCQSKTTGLIDETPVTLPELNRQAVKVQQTLDEEKASIEMQIAKYNAKAEAMAASYDEGVADIQRKDEIKQQLFTGVLGIVQSVAGGTATVGDTIPIAGGLLGLAFGIGATIDNRRKDAIIAKKIKAG